MSADPPPTSTSSAWEAASAGCPARHSRTARYTSRLSSDTSITSTWRPVRTCTRSRNVSALVASRTALVATAR